jgi:extradiol dioxygenase family protein
MTASVSAVLFAKDARRLTQFYSGVFGGRVLTEDDHYASLDVRGFRLVVHQIPAHYAKDIEIGVPPLRRELGAIRLDYPVDDLVGARSIAKQLGGQIDELPPGWAGADRHFFLGFDPEGNVFGVKVGN